jgi:hypothetical protein
LIGLNCLLGHTFWNEEDGFCEDGRSGPKTS